MSRKPNKSSNTNNKSNPHDESEKRYKENIKKKNMTDKKDHHGTKYYCPLEESLDKSEKHTTYKKDANYTDERSVDDSDIENDIELTETNKQIFNNVHVSNIPNIHTPNAHVHHPTYSYQYLQPQLNPYIPYVSPMHSSVHSSCNHNVVDDTKKNVMDETGLILNETYLQLVKLQGDLINSLTHRVNTLEERVFENNSTLKQIRDEHDAFRRAVGQGFSDIEKDIKKMSYQFMYQNNDNKLFDSSKRPISENSLSTHVIFDKTEDNPNNMLRQHQPLQQSQIQSLNSIIPNSNNYKTSGELDAGIQKKISRHNDPNTLKKQILAENINSYDKKKNYDKNHHHNQHNQQTNHDNNHDNNHDKHSDNGTVPADAVNAFMQMLPLIIFLELNENMQKNNKHEKKEIFNEVKMPNMDRKLWRSVETLKQKDFKKLTFRNLDDIERIGKKFLDMTEKHNKIIQDNKTKKYKNKKSPNEKHSKHNENLFFNILQEIEDESDKFDKLDKKKVTKECKLAKKETYSDEVKFCTDSDGDDPFINFPEKVSHFDLLKKIKGTIGFAADKNPPEDANNLIKRDKNGLYSFFGKKYSINPKKLMRLVKPIQILNSMIGMGDIKKSVFQFVAHFLHDGTNNGMLNTAIYGGPGVGKTDLGKILCMIYSALEIVPSEKFKLVRASDLIGEYVGHTRQKTMKVIEEADGGVLFIDEVYSLMSGSGNKSLYGKECIDTINQELSERRRKLVVIIGGYEDEVQNNFFKINKGLQRRFPFRYSIKEYTKEELKNIFVRMLRLQDNVHLYKSLDTTSNKSNINNKLEKNIKENSNDESNNGSNGDLNSELNTNSNDDSENKKENIPRANKDDQTVTDDDILDLFDDIRYFNNCGGDIENLITHISFANSERTVGGDPNMRNVYTKEDLKKGLKMFKFHKAEHEDETWRSMFN
jgi:hypothetical protein